MIHIFGDRIRLIAAAWVIVAAVAVGGALVLAPPRAEAAVTTSTVAASADTFTRVDKRSANYGSHVNWAVDGRSPVKRRSYVKFKLPATPTGTALDTVKLTVYVETDGASRGPGPNLHRTSNAWSEPLLVWANQPALGPQAATTTAAYKAGVWVSWDVTASLSASERTEGGPVSFALWTREQKWLGFRSRETGYGPKLELTTTSEDVAMEDRTDDTDPDPAVTDQAAAVRGWGSVVAGDEFDYVGAPDRTKWGVYNSVGHAGNGIRSPKAWLVENGVVTVTGDEHGTTGGMSARFDRRMYGRWEVRMRTNARDPEYHPVLILWPDAGRGDTCPEIDFAESTSDTTALKFFYHYGCGGQQTWAKKPLDSTEWHNYAVEWTPEGVIGFIDGIEWFRDMDPSHLPPGPMHQTIQLDWFPDGTATTASFMQVDWVRVYDVAS